MTADPRHDYLAAYRRSVESPSEVREANLQAVLERSGQVDAVAAQPTRWAASALIFKVTTVALVTAGLGWGAVAISPDAPKAPTALKASTPPSAASPGAPPRPSAPRPAATAAAPLRTETTSQPNSRPDAPRNAKPVSPSPSAPAARPAAAKPAPRVDADQLREELALLEIAQQRLREGKTSKANEALREHARRFPQGTLSVERAAWSAIAACSGTGPQPQAAARSFVLTHGDTPLGAKVKAKCGL